MVLSHLTPGTHYTHTQKVVWIFWLTSEQSARRRRGFLDGDAHIKQNVSDKKSNILWCWAREGNFWAGPLWQTTAVFALDCVQLRSIRVGRLKLLFKYGRARRCLVMLNRCARVFFSFFDFFLRSPWLQKKKIRDWKNKHVFFLHKRSADGVLALSSSHVTCKTAASWTPRLLTAFRHNHKLCWDKTSQILSHAEPKWVTLQRDVKYLRFLRLINDLLLHLA